MPTYEYACSSCHHEWEFEQSIKDDPIKECPACHQGTAKRQISRGTGFILKGSGWYADLYSSSSNKPAGGDKPADTSTTAKKDEASKPSGSGGTSGSSEGSGSSSGGTSSGSSGSTPAPSGSSTKSSSAAAV